MQAASQAYKDSMKQPLRNPSFMRVSIGVINQEAQRTAYADLVGSYAYISTLTSPFNTNRGVLYPYATAEQNYSRVDGSMAFPPALAEDVVLDQGIVSDSLIGTIEIDFPVVYDIKGLTIDFSDNYPVNFNIVTSNKTVSITGNTERYFVTQEVFSQTSFVRIVPALMVSDQNRLRIQSINMGAGIYFDNKKIITSSLQSVISPISEDLPTIDFNLAVDNTGGTYCIEDLSSSINFLETGQKCEVLYGYDLDGVTTEWIKGSTIFLKTWSADNKQMKLSAVDRFEYMQGIYRKGKYYAAGISLYDLAVLVLTDAGLDPEEYWLDGYLDNVIVYNPLPVVTHKEALQIIANAGRCIMSQDRNAKVYLRSSFIPDMTVTSANATEFSTLSNVLVKGDKDHYATADSDTASVDGGMYFLPSTASYLNTAYVSSSVSGGLTNLLGNDGNMNDSNADNKADGWTYTNAIAGSCINNEVTFTANAQYGQLRYPLSVSAGDVIYFCGEIKSTYGTLFALSKAGTGPWIGIVTHSGNGAYQRLSNVVTIPSDATAPNLCIGDARTSGYSSVFAKNMFVCNLTRVFGAGNEPTKTQMDTIVQGLVTKYEYLGPNTYVTAEDFLEQASLVNFNHDYRFGFASNPKITISLETAFKCYSLSIQFGENAPREYIIRTYLGVDIVDTITVANSQSISQVIQEFSDFDKIEIEVTKDLANNRVLIDYVEFGDVTDYVLERARDLTNVPVGSRLEKVAQVQVSRTMYNQSGVSKELINEDVTASSTNNVFTFEFTKPSYGFTVSLVGSLVGKSIAITDSGAYFITVTLSGYTTDTLATISIVGFEYTVTTAKSIYTVNPTGTIKTWDNVLIGTESHAVDVAEWLAGYYAADKEYAIGYRGDPRIDANDILFLEVDSTIDPFEVRVCEHKLEFNSTLSGTITGRRIVDVG